MSGRTRTTEPGEKRGTGDSGGTVFDGEIVDRARTGVKLAETDRPPGIWRRLFRFGGGESKEWPSGASSDGVSVISAGPSDITAIEGQGRERHSQTETELRHMKGTCTWGSHVGKIGEMAA